MYYINKNVENLLRITYMNRRKDYLRLDLNENPGGLPEAFIKKVLAEVDPCFVSEYPEMQEFTETLAAHIGAEPANLCVVNGSSEGIRFVIEAFTSPEGKIVGVAPSYAMYQVYAEMYGREFIPVEYDENLNMPIENILDKLTEDIQLLILVNPNNPMGNTYTEEEFVRILEKAREKQVTVLVDEAYHYFYPDTFIKYALAEEHIFVTRTFSKLFSLAGARLGYVAGRPKGIKTLNNLCTPHNVNAFAMLFAQKMLENPEVIQSLIDKHKEGRLYLQNELTQNGYEYQGEAGNFIFIRQKTDADTVVRRMEEEKKILIKSYNGIGKFGKCLRVTTAEKKYMQQFMEALLELDR